MTDNDNRHITEICIIILVIAVLFFVHVYITGEMHTQLEELSGRVEELNDKCGQMQAEIWVHDSIISEYERYQ